MRFRPNLRDGRSPDTATVNVAVSIYGQGYTKGNPADDWAILKIDRPLGDNYGYLGWRRLNLTDDKVLGKTINQVRLAGYSGDFPDPNNGGQTAGVHAGCNILGTPTQGRLKGLLFHQCDSMGGASGSPMFALFNDGIYYIVGLHSGWYELDTRSIPPAQRQACKVFDDQEKLVDVEACVNRGVQVSRWSAQAEALRKGGATKAGN